MEAKIDCSFPCLVFLPERAPEQSRELLKKYVFDYVFFSPNTGLEQDGPQSPSARLGEAVWRAG